MQPICQEDHVHVFPPSSIITAGLWLRLHHVCSRASDLDCAMHAPGGAFHRGPNPPGALDEAPCPHSRLAPHCRPAVPAMLDRGGWCRCGARPGSQRDVGACFTAHDAGNVLSCVRRRIGVQRQYVEGDEASPGRLRGVILYSLTSQFARSHTQSRGLTTVLARMLWKGEGDAQRIRVSPPRCERAHTTERAS
jgi:hypothetical protein